MLSNYNVDLGERGMSHVPTLMAKIVHINLNIYPLLLLTGYLGLMYGSTTVATVSHSTFEAT